VLATAARTRPKNFILLVLRKTEGARGDKGIQLVKLGAYFYTKECKEMVVRREKEQEKAGRV